MDTRPRRGELTAHGHEEGVEGVVLDAVDGDLAAVEAASELRAPARSTRRIPRLIERALWLELGKPFLELERVEGTPLGHHRGPILAKGFLEFLGADREVFAGSERGLFGDRIVVLINEALTINFFARHDAFLEHSDPNLCELGQDDLEHSRCVGMRLGEDECRVLLGRARGGALSCHGGRDGLGELGSRLIVEHERDGLRIVRRSEGRDGDGGSTRCNRRETMTADAEAAEHLCPTKPHTGRPDAR